MKTPFKNDPFSIIYQAFECLFPEKQCDICWGMPDDAEENAYGITIFPADKMKPTVFISPDYPVSQQAEILAHELAHVAVGAEQGHDETWDAAFDAIQKEYDRIVSKLLGGCKT